VINFSAITWWEQVTFGQDNDDVCFVLDQQVKLDIRNNTSSLKQQFVGRHDAKLEHINQSLLLLLNAACLVEKQQIPVLKSLQVLFTDWGKYSKTW
jgi:hypothetical protein